MVLFVLFFLRKGSLGRPSLGFFIDLMLALSDEAIAITCYNKFLLDHLALA